MDLLCKHQRVARLHTDRNTCNGLPNSLQAETGCACCWNAMTYAAKLGRCNTQNAVHSFPNKRQNPRMMPLCYCACKVPSKVVFEFSVRCKLLNKSHTTNDIAACVSLLTKQLAAPEIAWAKSAPLAEIPPDLPSRARRFCRP